MPQHKQTARPRARVKDDAEIASLIIKLRWIGMDDEAERMCGELAKERSNTAIVVSQCETD